MTGLHVALGIALLCANVAAAVYGTRLWWLGGRGRGFWPLMRAAQALVAAQALLGGVLAAGGRDLPELHLVYGLAPLGVSLAAEQLRILSAQTELDRAGLEDARAVGSLPEREQRALVDAIVRREIGVMAASAGVVSVLAVRAAGWL